MLNSNIIHSKLLLCLKLNILQFRYLKHNLQHRNHKQVYYYIYLIINQITIDVMNTHYNQSKNQNNFNIYSNLKKTSIHGSYLNKYAFNYPKRAYLIINCIKDIQLNFDKYHINLYFVSKNFEILLFLPISDSSSNMT